MRGRERERETERGEGGKEREGEKERKIERVFFNEWMLPLCPPGEHD